MRPLKQHLEPRNLAQLAEGSLAELERERALQHLAKCPPCTAIYAEFAQAHLDSSREPRSAALDDWVRLGVEAGPPRRLAVTSDPKRPFLRRRALATAAVALTMLVGVTMLMVRSRQSSPVGLSAETLAEVLRLAQEDSYSSLFYSAQILPKPRSTRGSVQVTDNPSLNELRRQYAQHPDAADIAFWLITATLSTNQLRASDAYLTVALQDFPSDPRFANLAAIHAFKQNDLPGAERLLREALLADRSGVAKLNLALVLNQLGRRAEAEPLVTELRRDHPQLVIAAGL